MDLAAMAADSIADSVDSVLRTTEAALIAAFLTVASGQATVGRITSQADPTTVAAEGIIEAVAVVAADTKQALLCEA